jgi:HNH endonuclease/NUMOD4 motif
MDISVFDKDWWGKEPVEQWKDIADLPFHQVSDYGRIRVLPGGTIRNRVITDIEDVIPYPDKHGYLRIRRREGGKVKTYYVHHLVLDAFFGPCSLGGEARHLNGDCSDNRSVNLIWGTHKENCEDRAIHGTNPSGERNGQSILTQAQIDDIRLRPNYYGIVTHLAIEFNISKAAICLIRNNKRRASG